MSSKFCDEHEAMKVCTKSAITWPKFITILLSVVAVAVTVTEMVTAGQTKAIEKVEVESKLRDETITKDLKDYMSQYIIPMGRDIAEIKARVK